MGTADGARDRGDGIHIAADTQSTVNRLDVVAWRLQKSMERCQHRRFGHGGDTKAGVFSALTDFGDSFQGCGLHQLKPVTKLEYVTGKFRTPVFDGMTHRVEKTRWLDFACGDGMGNGSRDGDGPVHREWVSMGDDAGHLHIIRESVRAVPVPPMGATRIAAPFAGRSSTSAASCQRTPAISRFTARWTTGPAPTISLASQSFTNSAAIASPFTHPQATKLLTTAMVSCVSSVYWPSGNWIPPSFRWNGR